MFSYLKKHGASKGATTIFNIYPQTGLIVIFPYISRPILQFLVFFSGIVGGLLLVFDKEDAINNLENGGY